MKIKQLLTDGQGWHYSSNADIVEFEENGEMAPVKWYEQKLADGTVRHINGKYVIMIDYYKE